MAEYDYLELGRGGRAAVWVALYIVCWLLMAWSCNIGLPSDCRRAAEPMEVLIELSVLTAFSLGQVNNRFALRSRCWAVHRQAASISRAGVHDLVAVCC